jgi:adenosylcobinamide hydrolase
MKLYSSIGSIKAQVDSNKLVILSERPLNVLSSAVLNGGFTKANGIISIHVTEDRDEEIHKNPENLLKRTAVKLRLDPDKVVGMMTAADLRKVEVFDQRNRDTTLSAFVTAGVGRSATAGEATVSKRDSNIKKVGTINIILLVDGNLTESCMVDAVKTATEAKTVAMRELDVRSYFSGDLASGTVTDTTLVACTKRGKPVKYAGTATALGEMIGKAVKQSVKKAIQKQEKMTVNRSLTQRLEERGISIPNMITIFSEAHSTIRGNSEKLGKFAEELQRILHDPNVASLVIAALRLDDDAKMGLIPVDMCDKSQICGILQTAAIDCLYDENVASKYLKLDDKNLAAVQRLGPFTRSVLAAIMNRVCSNM